MTVPKRISRTFHGHRERHCSAAGVTQRFGYSGGVLGDTANNSALVGIPMNLWKRLLALFQRKAEPDNPTEPQSRREALDEQARNAARIADARLPPHSSSLPY